METSTNSAVVTCDNIWTQSPKEAFHWERLQNGKCVWHCRKDGKSFDKKAPNFKIERNALWRDPEKQKEADQIKADIKAQLTELNIVLA